MCKFCDIDGENIRYDEEVEIQIMDNVLYVQTWIPTEILTEIEIKYCPMCGKGL